MAIVVRWKADGDYLESARVGASGQIIKWTGDNRRAKRFDSQQAFRTWTREVGLTQKDEAPWWWGHLRFVRLVSKRRAEPEKVACLSEPTARDAVAGMLLRYGFPRSAGRLALHGWAPADLAAEMQHPNPDANRTACIAALEALARGDLRAAADVGAFLSMHATAVKERDEARAEAAALREEIAEPSVMPGSELKIDPATWPGEPAEEPSGMRIEKRTDGEYLIGNKHCVNNCMETHDGLVCHYHLNGEHIRTALASVGGAERILARWPIATPAREDEPAMSGGTSHPEALTSADGAERPSQVVAESDRIESSDGNIVVEMPKDADPRAVLATVAELLGLEAPIDGAELDRVASAAADGGFEAGVEEGERRAKAKAVELQDRWNATRARAAESSNVVKANATLACILHIRAAFGITDTPTDPGKTPRGEPLQDGAPKASAVTHGGVTVTAPDTMTLGEVWAALTSAPALRVCLEGETRRAREQGATEMRSTAARRIDDELRGMGAGNPAKTTLLRMYNRIWNIPVSAQEKEASQMSGASEAPADAGMRIERRGDGEWLVGAVGAVNDCDDTEPAGRHICTRHFNGQHIAGGGRTTDGAIRVHARWPIAPATESSQ